MSVDSLRRRIAVIMRFRMVGLPAGVLFGVVGEEVPPPLKRLMKGGGLDIAGLLPVWYKLTRTAGGGR